MRNDQNANNCMYNLLHTQFNEDFGEEKFFSYNLQYPSYYNLPGTFFAISPQVLSNVNSIIKTDVYAFKDGILEEQNEHNSIAVENNLPYQKYKVISNYATTFNKNHILSTIVNLTGFDRSNGDLYNELYNYNIDLLTGNTLFIKDIFTPNIDYLKLIKDYINYKINQNKDLYYDNVDIEITEDQAFYIEDNGVVIYFGLDEIAPSESGIVKFRISFTKFAPYINPRFFCATNIRNFSNQKRFK